MEILNLEPDGEEDEVEDKIFSLGKSVVVKTSLRSTYFCPMSGLIDPDELKCGELIGV